MSADPKRVLITGGAIGIGRAICEALLEDGYAVDFTYHSSAAEATALLQRFETQPLIAHRIDLSQREETLKFCSEVGAQRNYCAFVHNAGAAADALAAIVRDDVAQRAFQINFWSFVQIAGCLLPSMVHRRHGRIVAITSIAARIAAQGNGVYSASKAALEAYCRCAAVEVGRRNVTVNAVAPGFVDTELLQGQKRLAGREAFEEALRRRVPVRRSGAPDEVAAAVRYLLSDAASYTNGTVLTVDGGLRASLGFR